MVYFERAPKLSLRPWIRSLWYCRAPVVAHSRERVLPNGCMQIVLNLARDYLTDCRDDPAELRLAPSIMVGASRRYQLINTADLAELAGVVIEPGGFAKYFRERADLFFEKSVPLNDLWTNFTVEQIREAETPTTKFDRLEVLLQSKHHVNTTSERAVWRA